MLRDHKFFLIAVCTVFGLVIVSINAFLTSGIENDLIEAVFWGRELVTVTNKHPAGFGLTHFGWVELFGYTNFSALLLGAFNLVLTAVLAWLVLREADLSQTQAITGLCLSLASINTYLFIIKYNGNSAPAPFWLLAIFFLLRATRGEPAPFAAVRWWLGLGVFAGLAMYMKYHTVLLLFAMMGYVLTNSETRKWLATAGPYLAVFAFLLIFSPHLIELYYYNFPGFRYGVANLADVKLGPIVGRIINPLYYFLIQVVFALPGLGVLILFARRKRSNVREEERPNSRALMWFGPIFALLPCLVAFVTGGRMGSIWGVGTAFLVGPWLVYHVWDHIAPERAVKIGRRTLVITLTVFSLLLLVAQVFEQERQPKQKVAAQITALLDAQSLNRPKFVMASDESLTALSFYLPEHPRIVRTLDWSEQPWTYPDLSPGTPVLIEIQNNETVEAAAARANLANPIVLKVEVSESTSFMRKHTGRKIEVLYGTYAPE